MALTLNAPGVQINETDLSQIASITAGNTIFITGFADQGPTDEVVQLTGGIQDFQQTFGQPTNAAERYFYQSVNAIASQSNANILVSRLPYGSGGGNTFNAPTYGVLAYPIAPYNSTLSSINATFTDATNDFYFVGKPQYFDITEDEYTAIQSGNINWSDNTSATLSSVAQLGNSGFFVLNKSQSTLNSGFEGFYVGMADNASSNPDDDYNSILNVYTRVDTSSNLISVPQARLNFSLSSVSTSNTQTISNIVETPVSYNIFDESEDDMFNFTLFRLSKDVLGNDPNVLTFSLAEKYTVSLDAFRKQNNPQGGAPVSVFIESKNDSSKNLQFFVNPNISTNTGTWLDINNNPKKSLRMLTQANKTNEFFNSQLGGTDVVNKATPVITTVASTYGYVDSLFPISVFSDYNVNNKNLGSIPGKVTRILEKLQDKVVYPIDTVIEAGLGTIWTYAYITYPNETDYRQFDDTAYLDISDLKVTQNYTTQPTPTRDAYMSLANIFTDFVAKERKDCMFIPDPLRYIFVQGKDLKTLAVKNNYFSRDIYWPLRHQFELIDSSYVAIYSNWVKAYDSASDKMVWVPFSAHAAIAFANVDNPWNAPAGYTFGKVSAIDLAYYPNVKEQGQIFNLSINPVVFSTTDGFIINGDRTKQSKPSALRDINVRRTFLYFERIVANTMKYFVFKNNTFFTRSQVVNILNPSFAAAKNSVDQGLYNYKIVCNESNNDPETIDQGILKVDIALQVVRSIKFIEVNFIATETGTDINEVLPG